MNKSLLTPSLLRTEIRKLSRVDLESRFREAVQAERKALRAILTFIQEMDRRKLYLERSRTNCFEYLVQDFGYSASAAMRRINAARLMKDIPEIGEKLDQGRINLSQLNEVCRNVREKERAFPEPVSVETKRMIIGSLENKSTAESQQIIAAALSIVPKRPDATRSQADASVLLNLSLTKIQFSKLKDSKERAAHLLSLKQSSPQWSDLIELLAENFLGKYTIPHNDIPRAVLRKLYARSTSCEHVDKQSGRICGSRYAVQVDHIIPRWAGGTDTLENLQLLCGNHNRHKYAKESRTVRL